MFSAHTYIDMFQNTKRTLTDKVITDKEINKVAHNFIDAQTVFAKMLAKNSEDMTKYFVEAQTALWFPKSNKP